MGLERAARTTRLPCLTPCSKTCGGCRRARRMLGVLGVCGLLPSPVHLVPSSGTASRLQRLPRAAIEEPHARLILVRHGQSEWNRANRFTGWVDVDLTEVGISDAREAGKLLAAEGLEVDEVHTSLMRRAVRSAVLMLSTLNQCWWLWRFERAHLSASPRLAFTAAQGAGAEASAAERAALRLAHRHHPVRLEPAP